MPSTRSSTDTATAASIETVMKELDAMKEALRTSEARAANAEAAATLAAKARWFNNPVPSEFEAIVNTSLVSNYEKLMRGETVLLNLFNEADSTRPRPKSAVFCILRYNAPKKEDQNGFMSVFIPGQNYQRWFNDGELAEHWTQRSPNREARLLDDIRREEATAAKQPK